MPIVTSLKYHLDEFLLDKIDLMIERCTQKNPKRDALLIVHGGEGEGKTNTSALIAKYISEKTNRPLTNANLFFHADKLVDFAKNTFEQIIIWDEPALEGLKSEWRNKAQINLTKLLMTARKRRHFFIFNIAKFYKFNEYLIIDRPLGMIHMYSRDNVTPGRFAYIPKMYLERIYNDYRTMKFANYRKYTIFTGGFPHKNKAGLELFKNIFDEEQYEKDKDEAIMSIGAEKVSEDKKEAKALKAKIGRIKYPINNRVELAKHIGVDQKTIFRWGKLEEIDLKEDDVPSKDVD
jgi:hypothetical protein